VIPIGNKITGTATTTDGYFVEMGLHLLHLEVKEMLNLFEVSENKDVIFFPSKFTHPLNSIHRSSRVPRFGTPALSIPSSSIRHGWP